MPLVGETVSWLTAEASGSDDMSATWAVDFPMGPTMAKVSLCEVSAPYRKKIGISVVSFVHIARYVGHNTVQIVDADGSPAMFDRKMVMVLVELYVWKATARMVLDLGFWT